MKNWDLTAEIKTIVELARQGDLEHAQQRVAECIATQAGLLNAQSFARRLLSEGRLGFYVRHDHGVCLAGVYVPSNNTVEGYMPGLVTSRRGTGKWEDGIAALQTLSEMVGATEDPVVRECHANGIQRCCECPAIDCGDNMTNDAVAIRLRGVVGAMSRELDKARQGKPVRCASCLGLKDLCDVCRERGVQ